MSKTAARKKRIFTPYLMILPTVAGLLIFNFYPIFLSIFKSFYEWSGNLGSDYGVNNFVWFANYGYIFKDAVFWKSWFNVGFFTLTAVFVNFTMPFIMAELIFSLKGSREKYIYRVLLVVPMIVPAIVNFLLWEFIYLPNGGLISQIAGRVVDTLGRPESVKWGIRFIGVPWMSGMPFLLYLARLSSIDISVKEAARIDGAGTLTSIFRIDVPLSLPQFRMVLVLTVIGEIQDFVKIQTITNGGPGFASTVPGLYMYNQAFGRLDGYGIACAVGVVMLVVMLGISVLSNYVFKEREDA